MSVSMISLKAQVSVPALPPLFQDTHHVLASQFCTRNTTNLMQNTTLSSHSLLCSTLLSRYKTLLYSSSMLLQGFLWPKPCSLVLGHKNLPL